MAAFSLDFNLFPSFCINYISHKLSLLAFMKRNDIIKSKNINNQIEWETKRQRFNSDWYNGKIKFFTPQNYTREKRTLCRLCD